MPFKAGVGKWGVNPGYARYVIKVNGEYAVVVMANDDAGAFDWFEQQWDREHGKGDFDKQTVGVILCQ